LVVISGVTKLSRQQQHDVYGTIKLGLIVL